MSAINRRTFVLTSAALVAGAQYPMAAEFPQRPISIVVPYAAGGAGDTIMRLLSPTMEHHLGQPLVIDARPGGGTIGAQAVAKAAPDAYTLLLGATNNFVLN